MNRLLADTLSFLNGLIALVTIAVGAGAGYFSPMFVGQRLAGLLIGGLLGLVVATFVCGTIAYLALIESHLRRVAHAQLPVQGVHVDSGTRREPTL